MGQVAGDDADGVAGAGYEAEEWPEAVRGRRTDEVEPGYRAFEVAGECRRALPAAHTGCEATVQEVETIDVDDVTRPGNDVIGKEFERAAFSTREFEANPGT